MTEKGETIYILKCIANGLIVQPSPPLKGGERDVGRFPLVKWGGGTFCTRNFKGSERLLGKEIQQPII